MPDYPGQGSIPQIYAAMAALEDNVTYGLKAVDAAFQAFAYPPPREEIGTLYPFSCHVAPEWDVETRTMGSGSDRPYHITVNILVLVGPSVNDYGSLCEEASRYIDPLIRLYIGHRSIGGTVRNLSFGKGLMGDVILNNVKHYGIQQPIIIEQRPYMASAL